MACLEKTHWRLYATESITLTRFTAAVACQGEEVACPEEALHGSETKNTQCSASRDMDHIGTMHVGMETQGCLH